MPSTDVRYLVGLLLLFVVVVIWVSSSELVQWIFHAEDFSKPFFLTYIATSTFSLHLVLIGVGRLWTKPCGRTERQRTRRRRQRQGKTTGPREEEDDEAEAAELLVHDVFAADPQDGQDYEVIELLPTTTAATTPTAAPATPAPAAVPLLTSRQTAQLALQFCFVWFIANVTTNASLEHTTLSSSTIISSTSGLFTLALGGIVGVEQMSFTKLSAVLLCFAGVTLVSVSDHKNSSSASSSGEEAGGITSALVGDLLSLTGACMYGVYTVMLKYRIGHEDRVNMRLFFGFVGLFNIVLLWPGFIILHYTGLEQFEVPSLRVVLMLVVNAIVGTFISDYLWLMAMLMTSPVIVTLGLSLTIPLAILFDLAQGELSVSAAYWIGALLVIVGFVVANLATVSNTLDLYASWLLCCCNWRRQSQMLDPAVQLD